MGGVPMLVFGVLPPCFALFGGQSGDLGGPWRLLDISTPFPCCFCWQNGISDLFWGITDCSHPLFPASLTAFWVVSPYFLAQCWVPQPVWGPLSCVGSVGDAQCRPPGRFLSGGCSPSPSAWTCGSTTSPTSNPPWT